MRRNIFSSVSCKTREKQGFEHEDPSTSKVANRRGRGASQRDESGLHYAYKLLSYRGRSEKEMIRRLRMKGFDEPAIHRVIDHLKSSGFLDDRRLASSLIRYAEESKQLSISGTKRFLAERGVPIDIINDAVEDIDEMEIAKRLVKKKLISWRKQGFHREQLRFTPEMIKKLYGILYRRGYLSETIKEALKQFEFKEDIE